MSNRRVKSSRRDKRNKYVGRKTESKPEPKMKGYSEEYSVSPSVSHSSSSSKYESDTERSVTRSPSEDSSDSGCDRKLRVDLHEYRRIVDSLVPHARNAINSLSTTLKERLQAVQHLALSADCEQRQEIEQIIRSKFSSLIQSNDVRPFTVGSVFVGCMLKGCSGVPLGCSPNCAGSISWDGEGEGFVPCADSVYYIKEDIPRLLAHGNKNSGRAYIYVEAGFKGFSSAHYNILKNDGISHVSVHVMSKSGNWKHITDGFVPLINMIRKDNNNLFDFTGGSVGGFGEANWWWILLIVVVIIIIIVVAFAWAKKRKNGDKGNSSSKEEALYGSRSGSRGGGSRENSREYSEMSESTMRPDERMAQFGYRSGFSPRSMSGY